jgi:hypothetical protein
MDAYPHAGRFAKASTKAHLPSSQVEDNEQVSHNLIVRSNQGGLELPVDPKLHPRLIPEVPRRGSYPL